MGVKSECSVRRKAQWLLGYATVVVMTMTVTGKPLYQAGANDGATTSYTTGSAAAAAGDEAADVTEIEREVWAKNTRPRTRGQERKIKNARSGLRKSTFSCPSSASRLTWPTSGASPISATRMAEVKICSMLFTILLRASLVN